MKNLKSNVWSFATAKLQANSRRLLAIALAAVIGFTMVACDNGGGGSKSPTPTPTPTPTPSANGTFTITDIPEKYNGKYTFAMFFLDDVEADLQGYQSINFNTMVVTLPAISNKSVSIPIWNYDVDAISKNGNVPPRYSGNGTFDVAVGIVDSGTVSEEDVEDLEENMLIAILFEAVKFTSGSATKSWNDGEVDE